MKKLLRHPRTQAILARVVGWYCALTLGTTRWTLDGAENIGPGAKGEPVVVAFWHEDLVMFPVIMRLTAKLPGYQPKPTYTLVSHHRDGRFIGDVVKRFNIDPIYGSSSRGGAASMRQMLGLLRQGARIGITPDGPRGPRRHADPGVAQLAAIAGVPLIPCAVRSSRRWILNTWDRMRIPLPFGRGVMVCGPAIMIPRDGWRDAVPIVEAGLNSVVERAEHLCPS